MCVESDLVLKIVVLKDLKAHVGVTSTSRRLSTRVCKGGGVVQPFRALDVKSGGPGFTLRFKPRLGHACI